MAFNGNKIRIDTKEVRKWERQMNQYAVIFDQKTVEKRVDQALRRSVKPWQEAVNGGWMYKFLKRSQGRMQDPFGNYKIKGKRRGIYGRKVAPKGKGHNGGWLAKFFASPARQIKNIPRIPFYERFASKNRRVAALLRTEFNKVTQDFARRIFK
jgi:hypothetical protein